MFIDKSPILKIFTIIKVFAILITLALLPVVLYAEDLPQQEAGYINDFAGVIKADHKGMLTKTIEELEQKNSAEIVVVTINSASPYNGEKYKTLLFDNWKIGKKNNQDNGLLFLLVIDENRYYIAAGDDFEAVFSGNLFNKIDEKYLTPYFRNKNYDEGIYYGVSELAKAIAQPAGSLNSKQLKSKDYLQELNQKFNSSIDSGKNAKALVFALQAVEVASNIYGNNSIEKAQFLSAVGNGYWLLKRNHEAESAFKESLDIYEKTVPKDSQEFANASKSLAGIYALEKKYAEAKPLFETALSIEERLLGKDHQNNISTRKYLAKINEKLSGFNEKGDGGIGTSGATLYLNRNSRLFLLVFILLLFFITTLGVLKGAEKKAVFFNSLIDYKINLIIGLIFTVLAIFLSLKIPSEPKFAYAILFIAIFSLINIFVAFHINRGLKFIPLVVGFSRAITVFFIPILEGIKFVSLKNEKSAKTKEEGNEQGASANQSWIVDLGKGLEHFIGAYPYLGQGVLINKMSVDIFRMYKKTEEGSEKIKDFFKNHKEFHEEDDKTVNEGIDSEGGEVDIDEDMTKETDSGPDEENAAEPVVSDLQSAYDILGISENSTKEEIKSAYRKKILEYHPDRTGGLGEKLKDVAEAEAKKINSAYEIIMKFRNEK